MKIKLYLSFILVCCNILIFAQNIGVYYNISGNRNTVFVNKANVREKPSIKSNIVGTLNHMFLVTIKMTKIFIGKVNLLQRILVKNGAVNGK